MSARKIPVPAEYRYTPAEPQWFRLREVHSALSRGDRELTAWEKRFLQEMLRRLLNREDLRETFYDGLPWESGKVYETALRNSAIAVIYHLAIRLTGYSGSKRSKKIMGGLADAALGRSNRKGKTGGTREETLNGMLRQYGESAKWHVDFNRQFAARVRREACAQIGDRGPIVEQWLRQLAKDVRRQKGRPQSELRSDAAPVVRSRTHPSNRR